MLNSRPTWSWTAFSAASMSPIRESEISRSTPVSMPTPTVSISASTGISGSSISSYSSHWPRSRSCASSPGNTCSNRSTCWQASSPADSGSTCASGVAFRPVPVSAFSGRSSTPSRSFTRFSSACEVSPSRNAIRLASCVTPRSAIPTCANWWSRYFAPYAVFGSDASASSGPSTSRTVSIDSCSLGLSSRGACPIGTYHARPGSVANDSPSSSGCAVSPVVESAPRANPPESRSLAASSRSWASSVTLAYSPGSASSAAASSAPSPAASGRRSMRLRNSSSRKNDTTCSRS